MWQEQRRAERKSGKCGEYSRVEYKVFSGSFHAYKSMLLWRPQWEAFSIRILSEMMHPSPSQLQKSLGENLHSIFLQNLPFFEERWTDCSCILYSLKAPKQQKQNKKKSALLEFLLLLNLMIPEYLAQRCPRKQLDMRIKRSPWNSTHATNNSHMWFPYIPLN